MVSDSAESPTGEDTATPAESHCPFATPPLRVTREQRVLWLLLVVVGCVPAGVFILAYRGSGTAVPAGNPLSILLSPPPAPAPANGTLNIAPEVSLESAVSGITVPATAASALYAVVYTEEGFSPNPVIIESGDSVLFVNASTGEFWPASNIHPSHEILPDFDSLGPVAVGQTWMYTFDSPGEWRYHDHLNADHGGLISAVSAGPVVTAETPSV